MIKILLALPEPLLKELYVKAKEEDLTRSELIRNTLKYGLSKKFNEVKL